MGMTVVRHELQKVETLHRHTKLARSQQLDICYVFFYN